MDALIFRSRARRAMAADAIPEAGVYHMVGDADEILPLDDGRSSYTGVWDDRTYTVILEDDGETVVTGFERKRARPPGRRRRERQR